MPDGSGSNGGQAGSSGAAPSASNPAPPEGRVSRWTLVRQEVETNYKQRNAKMQTMFKALIMEARDEKDRHPCDMSGALDAGFSTGKVAAPGAVLAVDDKDRKKIEKHDAKMRKIQMTAMKESYREVQSRRKSLEMKNGGGLGPQKKATSQALEEKARMLAQVGSKAPAPSGAVRAIRKTNVVMQLEKREWLIDPRTSVFIGKWDMITGVALIFTALFTPFEIAYLSSPARWYDKTFLANRTVDIIFIIDIVIQFNLMQSVSDKYGDRWITDHWDIIQRYLRGWFAIDTCSTLISIVDIISVMGSDDLHQLKILRVMRVLRLIKLARLARASRIVARFETRHGIDYSMLALIRIIVFLLMCTHLSACLFTVGVSFTRPTPEMTWLGEMGYCVNATHPDLEGLGIKEHIVAIGSDFAWHHDRAYDLNPSTAFVYAYAPAQGENTGWLCLSPFTIYSASTYWAAMTITSIGYGDIVATRGNALEQLLATIIMLLSAFAWGQVVATFCSLIGSMSASKLAYRELLTHLNAFMRAEELPNSLQVRLREFFFKTKHLRFSANNARLFEQMSPRLQAETLWMTNKRWLPKVRFLRDVEPEFIAGFCMALTPMIFTPDDQVHGNEQLFVIYRGVALYGGKLLSSGAVWGEDMLLECEALRCGFSCKALSYLETNKIGRDEVYAIAKAWPKSYAALRRYIGFLALRRQMRLMSRIEKAMRKQTGKMMDWSAGMKAFFSDVELAQGNKIMMILADKNNSSGLTPDMRRQIKQTMTNASEPLSKFFEAAIMAQQQTKQASPKMALGRKLMGAFRKGAFDNPPKDGGGADKPADKQAAMEAAASAKPKPPPVVVPAAGSPASSLEAAATKAGGDRSHRGNHIAEPEKLKEGPTGLLTIGRGASGLAASAQARQANHVTIAEPSSSAIVKAGGLGGGRLVGGSSQDAGLAAALESCRDQMVNEMKAVMKQQAQAMEERLENVVRRSEQMGWQLVLPHLASASGGAPGGSLPTGGSSLVTQVVASAKARAKQISPEKKAAPKQKQLRPRPGRDTNGKDKDGASSSSPASPPPADDKPMQHLEA